MPLRKFIDSANFAIEGILHAARTQRHLRYHFYAVILILFISYLLGLSKTDFLIIAVTSIIVLLAEMLNTALENVVDMFSIEYNDKAKAVKDIAAGAVLITAFGALVVGFIVLFPYLDKLFRSGFGIPKHAGYDVAIISIVIVVILVVITKAYLGKGMPLKGGMPSGHAAVAFSVWTSVVYITRSFLPSILVFILAVLIAQSRVTIGAHRPWEVVLGALLGISVTFLFFIVFA